MNTIEEKVITILLFILLVLIALMSITIIKIDNKLSEMTSAEAANQIVVNACTLEDLNIGKEISYKYETYIVTGLSFDRYESLGKLYIDIEGKKN